MLCISCLYPLTQRDHWQPEPPTLGRGEDGGTGPSHWSDLRLKQLGHSAYFNTAVTKQDFMKILGVSSQKWCKIISYYHGDVKQTMVYLIAPSVLILIKWDVTKQDFFLVLWLNHLQLLSKIIGYYHGNRE